MIKIINIIFLALVFWVLLFVIADAIAALVICLDKAVKRTIKKRRCING